MQINSSTPDSRGQAPAQTQLLELVVAGSNTRQKLAQVSGHSKQRISYLVAKLLASGRLIERGRILSRPEKTTPALPKVEKPEKSTPILAPPHPDGSAPIKERAAIQPPATEQSTRENVTSKSPISNFSQLAQNRENSEFSCHATGDGERLKTVTERKRRQRERERQQEEQVFTESADWIDFIHLNSLPRMAGCYPDELPVGIVNEAMTNACDAGRTVSTQIFTDPEGNLGS